MSAIELIQHWTYSPYAQVIPIKRFTFPHNPEKIDKTVGTEWRIRHVGRRFLPKARWRRRMTDDLKINGRMMIDDCNLLRDFFLEPIYTTLWDTKQGRWYHIVNGSAVGIRTGEIWCLGSNLEITPLRLFKKVEGVDKHYAGYKFTLKKIKDLDYTYLS